MEPTRHDPPAPDRQGRTWLTNLRLPEEADRRWRVAIDGRGRIATLQPLPPGSRAAGSDCTSIGATAMESMPPESASAMQHADDKRVT